MTEAHEPDTMGGRPSEETGGSPGPAEVPAEEGDAAQAASADGAGALQAQLAERTADLQRVQAEYLNYKRRVERDRELVKQTATYTALVPIVEVLDTIDRAREHGELEGGLKAVAEQLERVVAGVGLIKFGEVGDPFDPNIHEALSHIGEDPEVTVTTCKVIAKAGYRIGDRVVRAAQVLVVDPASHAGAEHEQTPAQAAGVPADGVRAGEVQADEVRAGEVQADEVQAADVQDDE